MKRKLEITLNKNSFLIGCCHIVQHRGPNITTNITAAASSSLNVDGR